MCGLVGAFGDLNHKHEKAFTMLLLMDQVRGYDSTGIYGVSKHNKNGHLNKGVGGPSELFGGDVFTDKGTVKGFYKYLMGHNRAATIGSVNSENAHPFEFEHIVGAMNGTLRHVHGLHNPDKHPVDTYALLSHVNKHSLKEAWKVKAGACALSLYDKNLDKVILIRNGERPLSYIYSKDKKVCFYASDYRMILWAASYAGVDLLRHEEGENKDKVVFQNVPIDTMLLFDPTKALLERSTKLEANFTGQQNHTTHTSNGRTGAVGFEDRKKAADVFEFMKERGHVEEKKTYIPSVGNVNRGRFHSNYTNNPTARRNREVKRGNKAFRDTFNKHWANNSEKVGKDSVDVRLRLVEETGYTKTVSTSEEIVFTAQTLDGSYALEDFEIVPVDKEQCEKLRDMLKVGKDVILSTTSRARKKRLLHAKKHSRGILSRFVYRIEASHVKEVTYEPAKKSQPEVDESPLYTFGKRGVSASVWESAAKQAGSMCYNCAEELSVFKATQYLWLGVDKCLCENCGSNDRLVDQIYGIGV